MEILPFEKGARLLGRVGVAENRLRYNHNCELMIVFINDDIVELHSMCSSLCRAPAAWLAARALLVNQKHHELRI